MALDLGKLLAEGGPKMGTERIEYIPLDRLVGDERNFYELSGIDELAANIELIGLQQPIRVRAEGDRYRIVSGHRRHAAIRKLVADGNKDFERVACIVETVECSEAMQELRLIYANSDTRKMTSAELAKQAERVEELFYQLKEEGFEFPGRMRDHVAQACQTTKSKLSRLKVIRERLHENLLTHWYDGRISDAVAYAIAKESDEVQDALWSRYGSEPRTWTLEIAERKVEEAKRPAPSERKVQTPSALKEMAKDYLELWQEENEWFFSHMKNHIFDDFVGGLTAIQTRKGGVDYLKDFCSGRGHWSAVRYETAKNGMEVWRDEKGPEKTKRSWTEVWDAMACIALQRCAAEHNKPKPVGQMVFNGWMPGGTNPGHRCSAVVVFELGGRHIKRICCWDGSCWTFDRGGAEIEAKAIKWMILPPDEEDV